MPERIQTNLAVDADLAAALRRAANVPITPAMRREQAISFAYGNLSLHDPRVTREQVERMYEELHGGANA